MGQNTPNPATGSTTINYELKDNAEVKISVFDNTGRLVQQNICGFQEKGEYSLDLNISELNPGVYYYSLCADNQLQTKKMIVKP